MWLYNVYLLFFYFSIAHGDCPTQTKTPLARLKNDLVNCGYDRTVRPVLNHKNALNVTFNLLVKQFRLDTNTDTLSLDSSIAMSWTDTGLKWDPEQYDGIKSMRFSSDEIWVPDLSVYNRFDQSTEPKILSKTTCVISNIGVVICIPYHHVDALCIADLRKFPYDIQNCTVTFGSWIHYGEEINVDYNNSESGAKHVLPNGEWSLEKYKIQRNPGHFECCPNDTYPTMKISLLLRRRHGAHTASIIVPSIVGIILTITSLWLSLEQNERLILCYVNLLAHLFQMQYITFLIPLKGDKIPQLVVLGRDSLLLCCFTIVLTLQLRHLIQKKTIPPAFISNMVAFVIRCRPGQIMLRDTTIRGVASARGDEDGSDIIDNSETSANNEDWKMFATILDRLIFICYVIVYIILMFGFLP